MKLTGAGAEEEKARADRRDPEKTRKKPQNKLDQEDFGLWTCDGRVRKESLRYSKNRSTLGFAAFGPFVPVSMYFRDLKK